MKTIGITAHSDRPLIRETTERILDWSEKNGLQCRLSDDLIRFVGHRELGVPGGELWKSCEVIITLGGDGSVLSSARAYGKYGVPIVGVNLGKLGFLTEAAQSEIEDSLARIKNEEYVIEQRMVLQAALPGQSGEFIALNDIVVDNGGVIRLVKIDLFSDGEFVCPYDSDGIIVATPTGSTAYSLSAGGPIINPSMDAIAVSPISPHTLALRAIIFPAECNLTIRSGSKEMSLRVAIDGQIAGYLSSGEDISVKRAEYKVKFLKFAAKSYYEILRTKLHWGARPLFNS